MIRLQLIGIWFFVFVMPVVKLKKLWISYLVSFSRHIFLGEFCCGHLTLWRRIFWIPTYWVSVRMMWKSAELQVASLSHAWAAHPHTGHTPGQSWHVEASDSSKNLMCKKENNKNHGAHKESMKSILKSQRIHSICGYVNLECLYEQPMVHQSIHLFFSQALAGETASVPVPAANLASVSLAMARMRCCWSSWQDCSRGKVS